MEVAQRAYVKWQQAGPLEKSLVVCEAPPDLLDPRLSRLEARALGMILESLPSRIKDELVVTKALTSTNAVFRILLAFQPGGLGERQRLISNLQEPGVAVNARHCSDQLRRWWHRWLSRSQDLGVNPPDPAILLAGLDKLCQPVISSNAQLGLRCNISRTQHQLDFCPTVASVTAYARLLQAEMETLALSGADVEVEETPKLTKKQRAAALRKEQAAAAKTGPKGGSDSAPASGNDPSAATQAKGGQGSGKGGAVNANAFGSNAGSAKAPCKFYAMKGGCKMGRSCWSHHDFGKASAEGRCYTCGSTEHRADACVRPQGKRGAKGEDAPRGASGASSSSGGGGGKGGPKASAPDSGSKGDGKGSQVRQVAADESTVNASSGSGGADAKVARAAEGLCQDLIAEATRLLKGFRIAAARVSESFGSEGILSVDEKSSLGASEGFYLTKVIKEPPKGARGLLDGGATNSLRTAKSQKEIEQCTLTQVSLALRHADLLLTPVGTLISAEPVAPIVPMGVLAAELECKVNWEGETCRVVHPKRGKLPIVMVNRCPELCAKITEELIAEIEDKRALVTQRVLRLKAMAVGVGEPGEDGPSSVDAMLDGCAGLVRTVLWVSWLGFPPSGRTTCRVRMSPSIEGFVGRSRGRIRW